jgi:hypothetical protein
MEWIMTGLNINLPRNAALSEVGPVGEVNIVIGISQGRDFQENQGIYSPARAIRLFAQTDGNFVLQYADTATLPPGWQTAPLDPRNVPWVTYWSTETAWNEIGDAGPVANNTLVLQPDGNLVVYDLNKAVMGAPAGAVFASNTAGKKHVFLRLQDDGNLVLCAEGGAPIWATNTSVGESKGANA